MLYYGAMNYKKIILSFCLYSGVSFSVRYNEIRQILKCPEHMASPEDMVSFTDPDPTRMCIASIKQDMTDPLVQTLDKLSYHVIDKLRLLHNIYTRKDSQEGEKFSRSLKNLGENNLDWIMTLFETIKKNSGVLELSSIAFIIQAFSFRPLIWFIFLRHDEIKYMLTASHTNGTSLIGFRLLIAGKFIQLQTALKAVIPRGRLLNFEQVMHSWNRLDLSEHATVCDWKHDLCICMSFFHELSLCQTLKTNQVSNFLMSSHHAINYVIENINAFQSKEEELSNIAAIVFEGIVRVSKKHYDKIIDIECITPDQAYRIFKPIQNNRAFVESVREILERKSMVYSPHDLNQRIKRFEDFIGKADFVRGLFTEAHPADVDVDAHSDADEDVRTDSEACYPVYGR